jgi:hypothetical protein
VSRLSATVPIPTQGEGQQRVLGSQVYSVGLMGPGGVGSAVVLGPVALFIYERRRMRLFTASLIIYGLHLHWLFYVVMMVVWSAPHVYRRLMALVSYSKEDMQHLGIGQGFPSHSPAKTLDETFELHFKRSEAAGQIIRS